MIFAGLIVHVCWSDGDCATIEGVSQDDARRYVQLAGDAAANRRRRPCKRWPIDVIIADPSLGLAYEMAQGRVIDVGA